jgi:3-oxoadipate enol-lactonase
MPSVLANDINIYYETYGNAKNTHIVLIGGLTRDHNIWSETINYLTPYFHVIVYDNRGAGQTDKPKGAYSSEIYANDLAALMDAINVKSAHIVGHSMGGFTAQYLAAKYPDKVSSLTLCSTCIKQPKEGITYLNERLKRLKDGKTSQEDMIRSALPWLYSPTYLTNERIKFLISSAMFNPYPQPKEALIAQIISCINHDATSILPLINTPALVLTGSDDKVMTPTVSRSLKDNINEAQFVVINDAAHMVQIEKPKVLCETIMNFALSV